MILTLFLSLLALSVVIGILGYFTGDEPYLTVGLFFLFLLSIVIITGNLEFQTGEQTNTTFSYTNSTLTSQVDTTTFTYTAWNDTTTQKAGWGLGIISGIGIALSLYNTRKAGIENG